MFYSYKSYDFVDYLFCRLDNLSGSNYIDEYRKLIPTLKMTKKIKNFTYWTCSIINSINTHENNSCPRGEIGRHKD